MSCLNEEDKVAADANHNDEVDNKQTIRRRRTPNNDEPPAKKFLLDDMFCQMGENTSFNRQEKVSVKEENDYCNNADLEDSLSKPSILDNMRNQIFGEAYKAYLAGQLEIINSPLKKDCNINDLEASPLRSSTPQNPKPEVVENILIQQETSDINSETPDVFSLHCEAQIPPSSGDIQDLPVEKGH